MIETSWLYVPMMAYGKERRKFIKDWFTANPEGRYCVNTKYRPQVKEDSDLKKLIRVGFLKQKRMHTNRSHARSYLVKA
jgi:hypothetical protein